VVKHSRLYFGGFFQAAYSRATNSAAVSVRLTILPEGCAEPGGNCNCQVRHAKRGGALRQPAVLALGR